MPRPCGSPRVLSCTPLSFTTFSVLTPPPPPPPPAASLRSSPAPPTAWPSCAVGADPVHAPLLPAAGTWGCVDGLTKPLLLCWGFSVTHLGWAQLQPLRSLMAPGGSQGGSQGGSLGGSLAAPCQCWDQRLFAVLLIGLVLPKDKSGHQGVPVGLPPAARAVTFDDARRLA